MIDAITLSGVLPQVFAAEPPEGSHVWLARELTFSRGCRVVIDAASGRGKSSLLSFIYGSRTDFSGTIAFTPHTGGPAIDSATLTPARWCELRARSLAYMPQQLGLFGSLTALENVEIKNQLTATHTRAEIERMLAMLGLADRIHTPACRLSLGQQQRVAAVRAICQPFDFLLLDEPVSHLDRENNRLLADLFEREATARGAGIITTCVGQLLLLPPSPSAITLSL